MSQWHGKICGTLWKLNLLRHRFHFYPVYKVRRMFLCHQRMRNTELLVTLTTQWLKQLLLTCSPCHEIHFCTTRIADFPLQAFLNFTNLFNWAETENGIILFFMFRAVPGIYMICSS